MRMTARPELDGETGLRSRVRDDLLVWAGLALADRSFVPAAHHRLIAAELSLVESGQTPRLMLMLPPGSAKSTYASLLFPAWWFARHPRSSVIVAAHTAQLAEHFGRGVRGLAQAHAGRLQVMVSPLSRAAGRFSTEDGSEYFATGVRGSVTGRRADLVVIDDPVRNAVDADSLERREALWEWYRTDLITRLKPGGRIVLIMTRWHADDLCGRLLESEEPWRVLRLPALAELDDPLGRRVGEPLWPEWEDIGAIERKRATLGERMFSALFQQQPLGDEGRLFDVRQLEIVDRSPQGVAVRAWDLAATATGDWTVGVKLVRDSDGYFIIADIVRLRGGPGQVLDAVRQTAEADGSQVMVLFPQDPGQAGRFQAQWLVRELAGFRVLASPETGSKVVRALPLSAQVARGNVRVQKGPWNAALMSELAEFPHGRKDDQVDALSRAFEHLAQVPKTGRTVAGISFAR